MALKKWKTLSRQEILTHPRMHLVEDEVELPDGNIAKYLRHAPAVPDTVTIIAINDVDELLIQKEYSYPPDEIMWQLPGGGVEKGEDIIRAANRELGEESSLIAEKSELIGYFYTNNRRSDQKQYVVVSSNLKKNNIEGDAEEFIESHWLTVDEVKRKIREGEILNVNMLAALNLWILKNKS